jgi:hypothetical protein
MGGRLGTSPLGKSFEDQCSDAYLPLRLTGRTNEPDPGRAYVNARTLAFRLGSRTAGKPRTLPPVSPLVRETVQRTQGQGRDTPHLRTLCAGAPKSARIPRGSRRSARLLAEAHRKGGRSPETGWCRGHAAASRHARSPLGPLRDRRSCSGGTGDGGACSAYGAARDTNKMTVREPKNPDGG